MEGWDTTTKSTLTQIPLLTVKAGPRDGGAWTQRLKEEYRSLIAYTSMNKSNDNDWFRITAANPEGTRWTGKCWYIHNLLKYEFDLQFDIPVTYPSTAPEIELPQLDGKTQKMYRGGKICLTVHFKPLWAKNCPRFGIAHALCLGLAPWLAAEIPVLVDSGRQEHHGGKDLRDRLDRMRSPLRKSSPGREDGKARHSSHAIPSRGFFFPLILLECGGCGGYLDSAQVLDFLDHCTFLYKESETGFTLPSTGIAAHAMYEDVEVVEMNDKFQVVGNGSTRAETGATSKLPRLPFPPPPPPPVSHTAYLQYKGDDENVDIDAVDEETWKWISFDIHIYLSCRAQFCEM
ncbi:hypothetical protein BUALT_Bualt03G0206900 [Buddleja alternifolia]|uniref:Ubiquitin-fold modifier-conjugating enzyme 1 n=1 Tax=Buddleja alternifolia TaxID=168488 RepID=A0AAV6XWA1_9LAMI|nr:hypothetical protein BUALT_Bualt03G0206900 [Buddleja alternifolia]